MSHSTRQIAEARCYEFGPFLVDAPNRLLSRAGEVVPLTSKVFDILLFFVQNSGRLLGKDEVMREVWPDSFVEEGNLTRNVSTLRKALGESSHEHPYIVTVPGRGYRFVARVTESESNGGALIIEERIRAHIVTEEKVWGGEITSPHRLRDSTGLVQSDELAAHEANVSLAAQTITTQAGHAGAARPITRLMVLPFRMLRADSEMNFLAFSVPDAVAGALSLLDSVVVSSPTSAARYSHRTLDMKQIAEEAQAEAVLTGTILHAGNGIRVTCELLEVPSGTVLWWHEPHVSLSDLFELQDDLVRRIVASLSLSLSAREHIRLKRDVPTTAAAYEFYLRGNELSRRGLAGFSDLNAARDLYLRCVEADPCYAPAWAQLGRCYRLIGKGLEHGRENFALAESAFQRALELNADLPIAHSQYAFLEAELGSATDAVARLLRCAQTGSASPELYVALVLCCRFCGLLEASLAAHERARKLDPLIATSVSHTYYQLGDYDDALRNVAVGAWGIVGMTLGTMGRIADGLAAFRNLEQSGMPVPMRAFVGAWRAMLEGKRQESLDAAERCIQHYLDPEGVFYMGLIMAHLGESKRALTVLNACMDRGFSSVHSLLHNSWLEGLRSTTQFKHLVRRAEARFIKADDIYRSAGGSQALGCGFRATSR